MTKQEFIRRRDSLRNRKAVAALVMLLAFILALISVVTVGDMASDLLGQKNWILGVGFFAFLVVGVSSLLLLYEWFTRRQAKLNGIICSRCGEIVSINSPTVTATGKCNHCGEQVVDASASDTT